MRSAASRQGKQGARAAWPVSPSQFTLDRVRDAWRSVQGKGRAEAFTQAGERVKGMAVRARLAGSWVCGAPHPSPPAQIVCRSRRMGVGSFTRRRRDKSLRRREGVCAPGAPAHPSMEGATCTQARAVLGKATAIGSCVVRACVRCRNLALDALKAAISVRLRGYLSGSREGGGKLTARLPRNAAVLFGDFT